MALATLWAPSVQKKSLYKKGKNVLRTEEEFVYLLTKKRRKEILANVNTHVRPTKCSLYQL